MITEESWEIADLITRILGLLLNGYMIGRFFMPYLKRRSRAYYIGGVFFVTMLLLLLIPVNMQGIVAFSIGWAAVFVAAVILECENVPQKIFLSVTAYLLRWFSAEIAYLAWNALYSITVLNPSLGLSDNASFAVFTVLDIFNVLLANMLLYLAFSFVNRMYRDKREVMSKKELILLLSPYLPILFGYWFSTYVSEIYRTDVAIEITEYHPAYLFFLGTFQIISFLVILVVIFSYQKIRTAKKEAMMNAVRDSQTQEIKKHIRDVERLYGDMRSIRHDMNNHLMILENLYANGKSEDADEYLKSIREEVATVSDTEKTGNPITDILITEFKKRAKEKDISFQSDFTFNNSYGLDAFDISMFLSNALNNAIEATEKEQERHISLKGYLNKNVFLIEVRNSYSGKLQIDNEMGFPRSSKKDEINHGYGFSNMRKVTEKYLGTMAIAQEENEVILTAMMQLTSEDVPSAT